LEGGNGTGKTSVLEALHYGCFLKSFRTNKAKDIVSFDEKHFFLHIDFEEKGGDHNQVQVGVSFEDGKQKKLVRFNQKVIHAYRDLVSHYRIISLAEQDLQLVQGAPEHRRNFLNQLLVLFEPNSAEILKKYRQVLEQRNKLLFNAMKRSATMPTDDFIAWTKQLVELAQDIQKRRKNYLAILERAINELAEVVFEKYGVISLSYVIKNHGAEKNVKTLFRDEVRWGRSLLGAHLDDFSIIFREKQARNFASRGQQKLIVFLIKIALTQELEQRGQQATLLLDDFLTDFDNERLTSCLSLISSRSSQTFVTCPLKALITKHHTHPDLQVIHL
jgi:DNA replication and repair protein RecF